MEPCFGFGMHDVDGIVVLFVLFSPAQSPYGDPNVYDLPMQWENGNITQVVGCITDANFQIRYLLMLKCCRTYVRVCRLL